MKPLFLYDIDGTILSTGGAGRAALDRAFHELEGVAGAFKEIGFGGRTDLGIVGEALSRAGLDNDEARIRSLLDRYLPYLERQLAAHGDRVQTCPGVPEVLDATQAIGTNALLTGNVVGGAERKLRAVGLWERFALGAYGSDRAQRDDLVPVARQRADALGIPHERVIVIGDTPHDISCARAGGAIAVAVCTGWSSREVLEAAEPDLLIEDLVRGRQALIEIALA